MRYAAYSSTTNSRMSGVYIALLVAVVVLQLFLVALWTSSPSQPSSPSTASNALILPSSVSQSVGAGAGASDSFALDRALALSGAEIQDSQEAVRTLHRLMRFIQANQVQLDKQAKEYRDKMIADFMIDSDVQQQGEHEHDHEHGAGIVVKPGLPTALQLTASHTHNHSGASSDKEERAHDHHAGDTHNEQFLSANANLWKELRLTLSQSWAEDMLNPERHHAMSKEQKGVLAQCIDWQTKYDVKPGSSWGSMPVDLQDEWKTKRCDDVTSVRVTAKFIQENIEAYNKVWPVPEDRIIPKAEKGMEDKVIAIIAAITTRTIKMKRLEDLTLFNTLLPSFVRTIDPGFEYWFYLGYDVGDPWLDQPEHLQAVTAWFEQHVIQPAKAEKGITVKLVTTRFENKWKKPGPAFIHTTGVAYADGATYLYRINDDIRFDTPWAKTFVDELQAMGAPYGVVGPVCHEGATHILVVDFTHRTHHDIFPQHYPFSFTSWYMDDWISQVYGRKRTKRIDKVKIKHLVGSHGTRYDDWHTPGKYLRGEILRGRMFIEAYMSHTPNMQQQLKEYREDSFAYSI